MPLRRAWRDLFAAWRVALYAHARTRKTKQVDDEELVGRSRAVACEAGMYAPTLEID